MSTQSQPAAAKTSPEEAVQRVQRAGELLRREIHKVIIGQEQMIEEMLICLFARGHCLTIGVPGLAKTLTVSTLARALHLKFSRIQFTPDLMPSDITGTEIIEEDHTTGKAVVPVRPGPDLRQHRPGRRDQPHAARRPRPPSCRPCRSTRSRPARTPSSWSRRSSSWPRRTRSSRKAPIRCPRPSSTGSCCRSTSAIPRGTRSGGSSTPPPRRRRRRFEPILSGRDLLWIQQLVREVPASDHMVDYAVDLVRATRPKEPGALDFIKNWLAWGAGPRAAQYIVLAVEGPGDPPRPPGGERRRHPLRGPPRAAAPHLHQFQRRRRGRRRRSDHRQDPPIRARAELRRARRWGRRLPEGCLFEGEAVLRTGTGHAGAVSSFAPARWASTHLAAGSRGTRAHRLPQRP